MSCRRRSGAAMGALCHILAALHAISGLEKRPFWHRFRSSPPAKRTRLQGMRGFKEKTFNDRLQEQAKARAALLERARAKNPQNDPEFAARQAERKRIAD